MRAAIFGVFGFFSTICLLMAHDLTAQESPAVSVQRAHEALQRGEWATAADLIHPDRLRRVRDRELGFLLAWAEHHRDLLRKRAAGEAIGIGTDGVLSPEKLIAFGSFRLQSVPGTPTIQELAALSPRDFFIQAFETLTRAFDDVEEPDTPSVLRIVDTVYENDSLAHVLYRGADAADHDVSLSSVSVMSVAKQADRWLLLDEGELVPSPSFALLLFQSSP